MELAQEHLDLIKRIIQSDKKYNGNEDLYEDFFNETCKRSLSILESVDDINLLEPYLKKIASTAIIVVLKNMDRVRRTGNGYINNDKINNDIDTTTNQQTKNQTATIFDVNYNFLNIKTNPEEIVIKKELLQSVYDAIVIAHSQNVEKQYLELYELRYVEGNKQAEIAKKMNISQSQVSKRLFELMESVKKSIN